MSDQLHPADELALALQRVNSLLATLSGMFDGGRDRFAVPTPYLKSSVDAAAALVEQAQFALDDINAYCDLTLLPARHADELTSGSDEEVELSVDEAAENEGEILAGETINFEDHDETIAAPATTVADEKIAQSYQELLRKLTAAEIFAVEQQALSPPGTQMPLLPLLRSLREDLRKIHAA